MGKSAETYWKVMKKFWKMSESDNNFDINEQKVQKIT